VFLDHGAGAYRSMPRARGCARCRIALVSGSEVGAEARIARSPAVRSSETLHDRCPDCATRLVRLTLEWEGVGQARIEECSFCGVLVIDGDEDRGVAAIVQATRALGEDVVERLVALAGRPRPAGA
jgi:hypothetical protein